MASTYSLKFSEDIFPFPKKVEIYRNNKNDSNTPQFFVFLDEKLYSYKFENFKWYKNLLINNTYKRKILLFPKTFENKDDIMMIKTRQGIDFYQYKDDKFNLLLRSNDYIENEWDDDISGWVEPGSFIKSSYFYDDKSIIGILAKNGIDGLQFYGVMKDMFTSGQYPIQLLEFNTTEFGDTSDTNFFLEDLRSKGQDNIIVRSRNGMEVYEFDNEYELKLKLKIPNSSKISGIEEKLFFPNLTGQSQKDIVLFNTSGLFIYQYDKKQNYNFIHYNSLFDKQKGWDEKYVNTVRFKDINFDGREEMFFTGPRGTDILTFDNYTLQWRSILDMSRNAVSERHSNLLEIGPFDSVDKGTAIIFTQDENKLRWATIEREEIGEIDDFDDEWPIKNPPNITSEVIPEFMKYHIEDVDKPHILLRDQLDFSTIIKGVDKDTGKASFELPLINLPNFANDQKMRLHYNGNDKDAGILGIGWSFPNCVIILDHQGSILPEKKRYFLLLEDFPLLLVLDSERSTDSVQFFKITEENSEVEILYYKNEERWEVDYKDVKQIYGRRQNSNEDAISYDLSWEFWRASGSSPTGQVELPTAWFLSEIKGGQTSGTYYKYDIINVPVPDSNKKFTREFYLKSVSDVEGNNIIFNYSDKLPEEYYLPPLRDEDGNYNAKKVQTRYLTGYSLTTYNYRQEIHFNYKVENEKRFLTEIVQKYDPTNRPVLQFSYKNLMDSFELERVILPTGSEVEFNYETMRGTLGKNALEDISLICDVLAAYKIDYGQDFVLISYINNQNHVTLRMYNKELTTEMYSSLSQSTSTRFPFLGQNSVIYYDLNILDDTLVFTLGYGHSTAVCILYKEEDKWLLTPKYFNFSKDAVIKIADDFVAVLDTTERLLEVIVWDIESKDWIKQKIENLQITNSTDLLLQISGRVFLIYNNETVTVGYRDKNKWHSKVILKFAGLIDSIKKTLDMFNVKKETYDTLLNLMKKNVFQVSKNFILISRWTIEGSKSFSDVELFTLNSNYEVVHRENHKISQDDLSEYTKEITVKDENNRISYFTLAYEKYGERLTLILRSFRGALMSQIETFCKNHSSIKDCIKKMKEETEKEIAKITSQLFIMDMQKYVTYLQLPIVTCGSKNLIYTGNNWKLDAPTSKKLEEEWSVSIDDQFLLTKQNSESSIKLFDSRYGIKGKKLIHDLQIKNITQISNKYPIYLAYQKENEEVNLLFYEWLRNENVNKVFVLPRGETISLRSDHTTLVTHAETTSQNENVFLNLRHFLGMKSKLSNAVVKKLTVSFDNEYKRYTGYDYHQSSVKAVGDIVFYEKTVTIPGNNRSSFGYVEEFSSITGNNSVTYNAYDASGKLIKLKQAALLNNNSKRNITEENETLKSSILLDISGGLEVAQFYPYKMEDEEVSYYGFEDYEINKIGTANSTNHNSWSFNEAHIVKQEFSLTGENYLHLSESRLLGVFQPRNQNQHYVASCWIRTTGKNLQTGQIAPYLKGVVYAEDNREVNGYFSEIKFQYDDWSYLEVVIDLIYSKEVFRNLLSSSNSSFEDRNSKVVVIDRSTNDSTKQSRNSIAKVKPFKIIVTVSPGINSTVDVDHIRFSPLKCNFKAAVYNSKTRKIKEIINANGLIKRHLYNNYQDQIVSINENGEIEKISTSTKASSIDRIVKLKSTIEVEPTGGFYEDFNPYAFKKRWNVDNNARWKIAPGVLYHTSNKFDKLKLRSMLNFNSYGIRLYFTMQSELSIIEFNEVLYLQRSGDNAFIRYFNVIKLIPHTGEILIIAENNRLMIWIDGGLYFDEEGLNKSLFDLNIYGNIKINDMLIFNDVSIQVNYFNGLDERVQEINLETANNVIVTEYLYDELGRQCILTKPTRLQRSEEESLLVYYPNFVTNDNPLSDNSIWKINRIEGEFESLDHYSYYQVTYSDNPLDEKSRIGLPGQEFSVSGKFGKRFSSTTKNAFINQNYPTDRNYTYFVEHKFDNIEDVKVFNQKNNTVAWLISVPGRNDVIATYEYNDDDKLIRTLSPLYHAKAGTHINPYLHISQEHSSLIVETSYDKMGNVIAETSPDSGKIEYLYNDIGLRKFAINYSSDNSTFIQNVVYFIYDQFGRLTNVGNLISPPEKEKLLNLTLTENNTQEYQVFYYSDFEREPTMRRKLRRTITYNDGVPMIEESIFSKDKKVVSKRNIVLNENSDEPLTMTTEKRYELGKLREIEYPVNVQGKPFKITYSYDKLGRMTAIGIPSKRNLFVEYAYNSVGHVTTEYHLPGQINFNFTRNYIYNSASFLTKLQDKFLTEDVYYTEGSYGGNGYGDGVIARTEFNATWHEFADSSKLHLNEKSFESSDAVSKESKLCFDKLKEAGYINQYNHQAKMYYPSLEIDLPIDCSKKIGDNFIQKVLGQHGFPSVYGHLYDYGPYQELIRAKYFVGEDIPAPLLPSTFAEKIPKINVTTSQDIWNILNKNGYITSFKVLNKPHGKRGKRFIHSRLCEDVTSINKLYRQYCSSLEKILPLFFSKKLDLPLFKEKLKNAFVKWTQGIKYLEENIEMIAKEIIEMLEKKGYLKNPLDEKFNKVFQQYHSIVPDIIKVLLEYFGKQLGESEFDIEVHDIDENGNHKHYYTGFDRYELKYHGNSNQIKTVNFYSKTSTMKVNFLMKHDSRGNVVHAAHNGIKNITYHAVSNRATSIELVDGRKLIFNYDAQGERVLKRVLDASGVVKKEVHYIRDEFGRTLVERELTWSSPNLPPSVLVTTFIYGPEGLVGFIRRNEYYSVIPDHEGSIRLVVKDGEVVAAYDYLPYGNLMRQYGVNSEAHISYRYTGQEWDEETGLYNYHARLYDPSIGRFYQLDPKKQYFSPYKYAGNSPVSMIDPNGEIAFFILAILGVIGAYFGGAAAAGSWNPLKWDYSDWSLWLGIGLGGLGGALAPAAMIETVAIFQAAGLSLAASIAVVVALSTAGAYFGMAGANNEWDPSKWDYTSPETWNGLISGAMAFGTVANTYTESKLLLAGLSSIYAKALFVSISLVVGGFFIGMSLASRKIDFTKPGVYFDILSGFIGGFDLPLSIKGIYDKYKKMKWLSRFLELGQDIELLEFPLVRSEIENPLEVFGNTVLQDGKLAGKWLALSSTYESFENQMNAFSSIRTLSSILNKKQSTTNDVDSKSKLKSIAKEIVDLYKKIIETYKFSKETYTENMRDRLEGGKIPNAIMSIAMTIDSMAFVAFSSKTGPGFLSSFSKNEEDNSYNGYPPEKPAVPRIIAINDEEKINNLIEHALEDKKTIMVEINYKTYTSEKHELKSFLNEIILRFSSPKLKSYFNNAEVENLIEKIGDEIKSNGYVQSKERTAIIILSFLLRKQNLLKKTAVFAKDLEEINPKQINKLLELEEKIVELEQSIGLSGHEIDRKQSFEEKKKMLISVLNTLREMKVQLYADIVDLNEELRKGVNIIWENYLKKYLNEFTHWSPTIFTEPQLVSLLMRDRLDFPPQLGVKYTLENLQYLSAEESIFRKYISEFEQIVRCLDCRETERNVTKILIDPEWESAIENERSKWLGKQNTGENCFKRSNVFNLHNQITSESMCPKTIRGEIDNSRKKRFAIEEKQLDEVNSSKGSISENDENISNHDEGKTSDDTSNSKSSNFTNNLFGWMRTSMNKLFDSKRILPEKASNSRILKGITDSNSSLSSVTATVDVNSTLLLLDAVVRKVTGQKYVSAADDSGTLLESRGYSLDIGLAFEKTMRYAASKSGISMHRFNIHYIDVQEKVIDKIMSGKLDEIAEILISHAESACPHRETGCPGMLSPKKFEKFIDLFSKRIDVELNDLMEKNKKIKSMQYI